MKCTRRPRDEEARVERLGVDAQHALRREAVRLHVALLLARAREGAPAGQAQRVVAKGVAEGVVGKPVGHWAGAARRWTREHKQNVSLKKAEFRITGATGPVYARKPAKFFVGQRFPKNLATPATPAALSSRFGNVLVAFIRPVGPTVEIQYFGGKNPILGRVRGAKSV